MYHQLNSKIHEEKIIIINDINHKKKTVPVSYIENNTNPIQKVGKPRQ